MLGYGPLKKKGTVPDLIAHKEDGDKCTILIYCKVEKFEGSLCHTYQSAFSFQGELLFRSVLWLCSDNLTDKQLATCRYMSVYSTYFLHHNCFHFILTLPLADQVMALNSRTKSCCVTCQTNSLEMLVFTATSHCTDSTAYQFSYQKITLKRKQYRSRANGCFHGLLSYLLT